MWPSRGLWRKGKIEQFNIIDIVALCYSLVHGSFLTEYLFVNRCILLFIHLSQVQQPNQTGKNLKRFLAHDDCTLFKKVDMVILSLDTGRDTCKRHGLQKYCLEQISFLVMQCMLSSNVRWQKLKTRLHPSLMHTARLHPTLWGRGGVHPGGCIRGCIQGCHVTYPIIHLMLPVCCPCTNRDWSPMQLLI